MSDEVIEHALLNIYRRNFNPKTDIEPGFFHAFVSTLNAAADKGIRQAQKPEDDFLNALRHNTAVFAAFKTHRLQNDVARQLMDSNGNLKPFERWKNDVQDITSHQCKAWLRTEYNTAVLRARQAANWQQFQREKDVLPNLEWMPSTSPNPGADHMPFWGTILPVDHPFWEQHRPGDRWNCKCDLRSTDKSATNVPHDSTEAHDPQPGLDNNPGSTAQIFAPSHPYIANAYPGAAKAVKKAVGKMESSRKEFYKYDEKKWEQSYLAEKEDGYVVTELKRIQEANASKNEQEKFKKESHMCRVAADNGHAVEFLRGTARQQGQTYDILLDKIPTDLKAAGSHNNIEKYAAKAYHRQGAKAILYELKEKTPSVYKALNDVKRKYPELRVFFYFKNENIIKEIDKKRGR